jgi:transposase InsO family protein
MTVPADPSDPRAVSASRSRTRSAGRRRAEKVGPDRLAIHLGVPASTIHRVLVDEWAYVRPYNREADRTRALARWLHRYNHHRVHTAIGGPPINRVTNLPTEHN